MALSGSVRPNLMWTLAGNGVHGASQWAVLSLIAKLGSSELLGWYALAVAISTPPMMLSHLNLRVVLATDANRRLPFADYLSVRNKVSGVAMLLLLGLAAASGAPLLTFLVGVSLTAENYSDLYFGALQRRDRLDIVALSMMLRGVGSVIAVATALVFTGSIIIAATALAFIRILLLLGYDRPRGSKGENGPASGLGPQWQILRSALPLGAVLMLISLTTNVPRYAIAKQLGTQELGVFAAVASFVAAGYLVTNALGQSVVATLARFYQSRDLNGFRKLATTTVLTGAGVGIAGVFLSLGIGRPALAILYRPEFAEFVPVLIAMMIASVILYSGTTLGYVNTSTRAFDAQLPLFAASALVCALASGAFIAKYGLIGAPMALASAAVVQILGHAAILKRALGKAEAS